MTADSSFPPSATNGVLCSMLGSLKVTREMNRELGCAGSSCVLTWIGNVAIGERGLSNYPDFGGSDISKAYDRD